MCLHASMMSHSLLGLSYCKLKPKYVGFKRGILVTKETLKSSMSTLDLLFELYDAPAQNTRCSDVLFFLRLANTCLNFCTFQL